MLFVGWATAATFLPRLSDLFGRKKVYFGAMLGHFIFYSGVVASRSLLFTTIFMFFLGIFTCGRAAVGYLYLVELTPIK